MTKFRIRINDGEERGYNSRHSIYSHAVMEAFGALGLPYPCDVEIWVPDLVEAGYGSYFYRIADFVDMHGNKYGCPSILTLIPVSKCVTS